MDNRAFTDPHAVLGLPSTASKDDVKAAFRRLALKVHPDVDPSPQAAARFQEVKRAADALLKGQHHMGPVGPGPGTAYAAWQAYGRAAHEAAAAAPGWRPKSRHAALWFCAATLVGGFGVFWFALVSHDWINQGYTWLTPSAVDERLHHPSPRRQQLVQLMMAQQAQQARQPRHEGAQQPGAAD